MEYSCINEPCKDNTTKHGVVSVYLLMYGSFIDVETYMFSEWEF